MHQHHITDRFSADPYTTVFSMRDNEIHQPAKYRGNIVLINLCADIFRYIINNKTFVATGSGFKTFTKTFYKMMKRSRNDQIQIFGSLSFHELFFSINFGWVS